MRVRVYDEASRTYFHSELYAALYSGIFERYLIMREGRLFLADKRRREGNSYYSQIHLIDPDFPEDWITLTNGSISDFPDFPKHLPEDKWTAFRGFPWVWEDKDALRRLLRGEAVPLSETFFPPVSSLLPGWSYVLSQEEAETLLRSYRSGGPPLYQRLGTASRRQYAGRRLYPPGDHALPQRLGAAPRNGI